MIDGVNNVVTENYSSIPTMVSTSWEVFRFLHFPMAAWSSPLDSGVKSAVGNYRVEARMGVKVRASGMMRMRVKVDVRD